MSTHRYGRKRGLIASVAAGFLLAAGATTVGIAAATQQHAPQPAAAQAGTTGPVGSSTPQPDRTGRTPDAPPPRPRTTTAPAPPRSAGMARSTPASITIPAIGVRSPLLTVGLDAHGAIQVPPLYARPSKAAWYKNSPTPGQIGTSVIEGHIDTYQGPAVFFRLGALRPGDTVDVTLTDGAIAVFRVTGVRQYPKNDFPAITVYIDTPYPSLRLITCGGRFDSATHGYLSNTVVYATLISSRQQQQGH
jgi:sortase (surface protein transpeptidase)